MLLALFHSSILPLHAESDTPARGKAEHVVLIVWDGMRPDFVTEANAPNLWKLARGGVTFRNHHSIYPSLTSVNAAALATGMNPARNGIAANWDFRPELGSGKLARMDGPETMRKADEITGGRYLSAATIPEMVQARGKRTAIAGTKTAPLLHSRKIASGPGAAAESVTVYDGQTVPADAVNNIAKIIGSFPKTEEIPSRAQDLWTTRALTEVLWKNGVPEYSVLWMSDPDRSQHATAPGSEEALAGIRSADTNLGLLLRVLEEKKVRERTDILLVSDHGFSTVGRGIDVGAFLREKGFNVASEKELLLERGQVRVAGNGGSNLYYVGEHDSETIARLVEVLQQTDFAGVIFSREPRPGAFSLAQVYLDTPVGADVVMAFHWTADRNEHGVAGMITANGTGNDKKGTHGTLSPFDVHNTFIAAGPDFRSEAASELPTSNIDVAATIIQLLGLTPPERTDGRAVAEGMVGSESASPTAEVRTIEISRDFAARTWRQYLRTSTVGDSTYFDEGNGEFMPRVH